MTARAQDEQAGPRSPSHGSQRTGLIVFLTLAVLTVVEFAIAVTIDANLPIMIVIALVKAVLIVHYFMHLVRIWRGQEED